MEKILVKGEKILEVLNLIDKKMSRSDYVLVDLEAFEKLKDQASQKVEYSDGVELRFDEEGERVLFGQEWGNYYPIKRYRPKRSSGYGEFESHWSMNSIIILELE